MILVTKPFLPPLEDYQKYLDGIWQRQLLTNMGPLNNDLEKKLKKHLEVKNLLFVSNGTIALQLAIKALDLKGEIITTPFTYVATTSSIVWEGCQPVFVDIDKKSFNIDPQKIEAAITKNTCAIIATHVYGNPCDVIAIKKIAEKHKLKVIYDAAHAFGVKIGENSIFEYGDISTCSTHATKLFHTIEGGFVVTKNPQILNKINYMRNFGHSGPETYHSIGINGKNSEFHAAMGLANYNYIDLIFKQRKKLSERYNLKLKNSKIKQPIWHFESTRNYAYYPIIFETETILLKCINNLKKNNIFPRRYFYPSLNNVDIYKSKSKLPVSDNMSKKVICLPLYHELTFNQINCISDIILNTLNN